MTFDRGEVPHTSNASPPIPCGESDSAIKTPTILSASRSTVAVVLGSMTRSEQAFDNIKLSP